MPATRFAYVSRLVYPDPAANALQTINMASAIAEVNGGAHLFVHDLAEPEASTRARYGLNGAPLHICSLRMGHWPSPVVGNAKARFLAYNSAIAALFGVRQQWRGQEAGQRVLFVRSRLDILYWGLNRQRLPWMKDWMFCCEIHDLPTAGGRNNAAFRRRERMAAALRNFDLVVAITEGLADDIRDLADPTVEPQVVPLCTGLPRLESLPAISFDRNRIVLGYLGRIDLDHGIDDLVHMIERLPDRYILRLVGRSEAGAREFLDRRLAAFPGRKNRIEILPRVQYSRVAAQIDNVDIALLPAGSSVHRMRYTSPLKLFDYMARGKPIVAARVPCYEELLLDGVNALLWRRGDPADLARSVEALANDPLRAGDIAGAAWTDSARYTYPARAERLLSLVRNASRA